MGEQPTNGSTFRWRLDQIEKRLDAHHEADKYVAEHGLPVHNEQLSTLREDVAELKRETAHVPIVRAELANLKESWNAARNAGYMVAVALVGLIGTIVWNGLQT